jgi:hypothetical protein
MKHHKIKIKKSLVPLHRTAVNSVMSFTLSEGPSPSTTGVTMDYSVIGSSLTNLAPMAAPVDGVLQEQFDRLIGPGG